jgi:hypothetical protein
MNLFNLRRAGILYIASIFSALPAQDISSSLTSGHEAASNWPGIKLQVFKADRLDADTVMIAIIVIAEKGAKSPTLIGFKDDSSAPGNMVSPNNSAKKPSKPSAPSYRPYSLSGSFVVDESNQKRFDAVPAPAGQPTYGPFAIRTTMSPPSWFQMSIQFKLPVPPPNPDGTIPVQKVDVLLPEAKGPIKGVIVPPLAQK